MIVTVDVGGTKTLVASFDQDGRPQEQYRFPTPIEQKDFTKQLVELLLDKYLPHKTTAISVALPGTILEDGTLDWAGNVPWDDLDMKQVLKPFYDCPIFIENDANLAGLAEANALTKTPKQCLYITVSTGIGTGIITNGRLDRALSKSEGGHMVFRFRDKWITWEDFASGKAIREEFHKLAGEIDNNETWQDISERLAMGFLVLIPALQPDVIVIGGGVGTHFKKYEIFLLAHIKKHLPKHITLPPIVQAKHPEEAVIYGCYYNAVHQLVVA